MNSGGICYGNLNSLNSFGNDNNNCRMCCNIILLREFYILLETIILTVICVAVVLGLVTRILYGLEYDIGRY